MESRFWSLEEQTRIRTAVEQLVGGAPYVPGCSAEIVHSRAAASWSKTPAAIAHQARMEQLAAERGIIFTTKDRGGLSDANHIAACGPICADGMGPVGGLDHSEKEYGRIDSAEPCVALLCAVLEDLAQSK